MYELLLNQKVIHIPLKQLFKTELHSVPSGSLRAPGQLLQSDLITDLYNKSFYKTKNVK